MARRTIASLEAALEKAEEQAERFAREATDAERAVSTYDAEAKAIAGCVAALNSMTQPAGRVGLTAYGPDKVQRILRFLADRYGVTWYDPPMPIAYPLPEFDGNVAMRNDVAMGNGVNRY